RVDAHGHVTRLPAAPECRGQHVTGGTGHAVDLLVHGRRGQARHDDHRREEARHEAREAPQDDTPDRERRNEEPDEDAEGDADHEDADEKPREPRVRALREGVEGLQLTEEPWLLLGIATACCHAVQPTAARIPPQTPHRGFCPQNPDRAPRRARSPRHTRGMDQGMSADTVVPLTDAYRVLRAVWPPEAPFAGVLARTPDDRTVLLVASREVEGWSGAEHGTDGHVLGPRDLVRCRDGVAVELDACTETLERLLDRREAGGLLPGESVTLAVALCRGLAELAATRPRGEQAWPPGRWWITAEARPLFVHDAHGRPADFET